MEFAAHLSSRRHLKCRENFLGAAIINNIFFFWDDIEDSLVEQA